MENFSFTTSIGFLAAIFTTFAFFPQVVRTLKTRDTTGLSLYMYSIFTLGVALWLTYGILIEDLPIIFANTLTLLFALIILFHKIKHG